MTESNRVIEFYTQHKIPRKAKRPDNYFDIGTRGLFENPFTEILSYLLGSECDYTHRSEFVTHFFSCISDGNQDLQDSFSNSLRVSTQDHTSNGNILDLVIYNDKYALVFENKINHWLANPLSDYEDEIVRRFPDHIKCYYVFSKNVIGNRGLWRNIIIGDIFRYIRERLAYSPTDKWDIFVREFLDHYIHRKEDQMEPAVYEFCAKHYSDIIAGNILLDSFVAEIIEKIRRKCEIDRTKTEKNWNGNSSIGVRCFPLPSRDSCVVLSLLADVAKYSISSYYEPGRNIDPSSLVKQIGPNYRTWHEGKCTCFCLHKNNQFSDISMALEELTNQLFMMVQTEKT